jgi:hypothetical protein
MSARVPHPKRPRRLDPRRFGRTALAVLASAAGLAGPEEARAAEPGPPVQYALDYRVPASCPGEDDFVKLIARRTSRARRGGGTGEVKYRFTIEVQLSDAGARGTLRIAEKDGGTTERDVPARDCANAIEAMALIAAVILDPRAATTSPVSEGDAEPIADAAGTTPAPPSRTSAPQRPPVAAPAAVSGSQASPRADDRSPTWQTRLRAAGALQGAVAPGGALGVAAGADLFRADSGLFEPRFALTAHFARGEASTGFGVAELTWYAGRLTACPVGWPKSGGLTLRGCAFAEAGALRGDGSDTRNPRGSTAFWLAAGPSTEIEVEVTRWLALAVEAGIVVPAFHDEFVFVPDEVAHQVPTAGAWVAAGVRLGPL